MKLLCGFYYPQKGSYRIYGHDFHQWNIQSLRSKIGLVSQNVFLFPGTVAENISYGKPGASREEIIDACRKANAHDFILQLPMGYETEIGERGAKLSGGQKQRLSIAHRLSTIEDADEIYVFENGEIVRHIIGKEETQHGTQ